MTERTATTEIRSLQDRLLYPSIPISFVGDFLQAARYRGLEIEPMLRENGLSTKRIELSGTRVSIDQYSRVLRQLGQLTNDAFLGFLSGPVPIKAFPVFCHSVVGCRDLRELIEQANRFYALFTDDFYWRIEESDDEFLLGVNIEPALPVDYRFVIHSLLLMTIRLFGWLLGEDVQARSVSFTFARDATDKNLSYLFGSAVYYNREANCIRMDPSYTRARLSCTHRQVALMLKDTRNLFLVSRNRKLLSQEVRRRLLLNKSEGWLEVEDVAHQLGMDKHQLWRKLQKEGTSFLDIRDHIKRDWALVLLEDRDHTIEQVAAQLHYSDVSAFRKAFRKWTGMQPRQYRAELDG